MSQFEYGNVARRTNPIGRSTSLYHLRSGLRCATLETILACEFSYYDAFSGDHQSLWHCAFQISYFPRNHGQMWPHSLWLFWLIRSTRFFLLFHLHVFISYWLFQLIDQIINIDVELSWYRFSEICDGLVLQPSVDSIQHIHRLVHRDVILNNLGEWRFITDSRLLVIYAYIDEHAQFLMNKFMITCYKILFYLFGDDIPGQC